ncbi:hypothetical protein EW146_g4035 [Bondarzewia mesenterica]|uniref:Inositol-pentakisphosphate 2-kinase n=1 Tax=Bondarzewia mesenterica TaxID=1095465 RepID=A0A4S4LWU3_9AGAM|nr:hypothetical protein EW146_g4035 [Bondarzewia mesenterica]
MMDFTLTSLATITIFVTSKMAMLDIPNLSTIRLSETSASDWKYISEGGATIVFSYRGPPHPSFDGTVLRLRKQKLHQALPKTADGVQMFCETPDAAGPDDPMIEFQQNVIGRLISPEFLVQLQLVDIEHQWLENFALQHDFLRPEGRRQVDTIDLSKGKAMLATDLVGSKGCAVEIKPKWGFLPFPAHLSPETSPVKLQTCRTCMHTHLRQSRGEPAAVDYCPLDLFSGAEERTVRAIRGLWNAWMDSGGAVNNLRIFSQGEMLKPDEGESIAIWSQTIFGLNNPTLDELRESFVGALLPIIMETPVLRTLSRLQRTLDALDREGLCKLRAEAEALRSLPSDDKARLSRPTPVTETHLSEPTTTEWASFLDSYLTSNDALDHGDPSPSNLRYYILAYLLSATFKDCSLIMKLPSTHDERGFVKVIDLDPKSVNKMKGWEMLDQQLVESYAKISGALRRICRE